MGLFMPAAIVEPAIMEVPGLPEVFATGAIVRDGPEVVRALFYSEQHEAVLRVWMPRQGFNRSLVAAWAKWCQAVH